MNYLKSTIHRTPLTTSSSIDNMTNKHVYFKMENQQKTGAFKIRGASYKIAQLTIEEASRGVIAASAGNHAQGVALAAAKRGIDAKIFMPEHTPEAKIEATMNYGATIVLQGDSFQEAYEAAVLEQKRTGSTFIHPFDDYDIMAGQGTIAFEMLEQATQLDTIIVPIGGGGLIAGIAVAAKHLKPTIKIIGVQATGASATYNCFHKHGLTSLSNVSTIADGIAVKKAGELTFPIIKNYVDNIVTVTDEDIAMAMVYMLERKKSLIEGAGASAFAALLAHGDNIHSDHCGIIVSGGNMDLSKVPYIQQLASENKITCLA
ncbi:threonine ammonia-lyase [Aquibacillus koreensis]|uniref:L-threonine dehydratase catabolic TdcB n=1 Tax=Aquibacillus koreensis TaxID=279446 RepID=A0A9X4AJU3_9BACI|nr:threonine ammonia-lyase [Aquibacillus koreensis]MCT2534257.1 threonine ammonia-lyase [Aquibacillus koreensis]MDC3420698.1 threonine ammonia-lyase [Aquibacillus koreensis]